jgi:hypothetical protein
MLEDAAVLSVETFAGLERRIGPSRTPEFPR